VELRRLDFAGKKLLYLNVMWKYLGQQSFPLSERQYLEHLVGKGCMTRRMHACMHACREAGCVCSIDASSSSSSSSSRGGLRGEMTWRLAGWLTDLTDLTD